MATLSEGIFSLSDSGGDIIVTRETQSCRTCQNYIRVFEPKDNRLGRTIYPRGFCAAGSEGDFSLMLSKFPCENHIFSKYNYETHQVERRFQLMRAEFFLNKNDRRTREYKLIHEHTMGMIDVITQKVEKGSGSVLSRILADAEQNSLISEIIYNLHREDMMWLLKRKHMTMDSYRRMIGHIQLTIANQLDALHKEFEISIDEEVI